VRAVKDWDPEISSLGTYSHLWIKQAIQRVLLGERHVSRDLSETIRKLDATRNTLLVRGDKITPLTLSAESGYDLEEVQQALHFEWPASLDQDLEGETSLYDKLGVEDDLSSVEIREALATLPEPEAQVIFRTMGMGHTLAEVGQTFDRAQQTVGAWRKRGLEQLRDRQN
jgi:RNA polymerase sigma factor (sigma-70 family)